MLQQHDLYCVHGRRCHRHPPITVTPVVPSPPRPSNGMAGQNAGVLSLSVPQPTLLSPPQAPGLSPSAPRATTDP